MKELWQKMQEEQQEDDPTMDPSFEPTLEEKIQILARGPHLPSDVLAVEVTKLIAENIQEALDSDSQFIREKAEQLNKR